MIHDPRIYTINYPKSNVIISKALDVTEGKADLYELCIIIEKFLKNENDAIINVALNLAPDVKTCQTIWYALNETINNYRNEGVESGVDLSLKFGTTLLDVNKDHNSVASIRVGDVNLECGITAQIFAIPLVLVAGSKSKVRLNGQLDTGKLNKFFKSKQIFCEDIDGFISGKLIDPSTIAQIKPSQLYYWSRNLRNANLWLPIKIEGMPIEVHNEGVFLRFLVGTTINSEPAINQEAYRQASMDLMQFIGKELKNEQVTLFPIPFAPVNLSEAFIIGDNYRKEVAIQVAISNVVRKIREQGLEPIARFDTADESIKLVISNPENSELSETSLWHLNRFDDLEKAFTTITNILQDMNIENICEINANT